MVAVMTLTSEAWTRPDGRGAGCDKPVYVSRVGRERYGRQDHPVLVKGGVMTTARKLGAVATIAVAVILTGCTTSTAHTPTSTTAPLRKAPPAIVVAVDKPALESVTSGSFAVNVPAGWPVLAPSAGACTEGFRSSEVIAGPMGQALSHCGLPQVSRGTLVVFAHGDPPTAPVLSRQTSLLRVTRVNGIWVTAFEGVDADLRPAESYLLAMLDGWDNWLLFVSPGRVQALALGSARAVLQSVHVVAGHKIMVEKPVKQDFAGTWSHGPDTSLIVGPGASGREEYGPAAGCEASASLGCRISLELKVTVSPGSSFLAATVTEVKVFEPGGHFVVDPPLTTQLLADGALPVGTRMGFEGVDHGMLVQVRAPREDEFPVEWPYWCNFDQQTSAERAISDYCT